MTMVDSHQHFWSLKRDDYGWLTPALAAIYRDYGPEDLAPRRTKTGVAKTILVQAAATEAETQWLLDIAARAPEVAGVVGWIDFDADDAAARIATIARHRIIVGLRPMMQDLPDDDWMLAPQRRDPLKAMAAHGLVFDALVKPRHLSRLCVLADRHPDLSIVIDHGAKPNIKDKVLDPWRADMAALAARPNTVVKLSGLVTEAAASWTVDDIAPYVAHLVATFGPQRILWGSDWPVLELASTYEHWHATASDLLSSLTADDRAAIFGGNAQRIYLQRRGRL